jgi:hypothetical protein
MNIHTSVLSSHLKLRSSCKMLGTKQHHHLTSPSSSPILIIPFFLLSPNHLSIQLFIFALLAALPTFTVGTTFSILSAQINIVNSLKLLCSLYGTPKQDASLVLPRCGTRSAIEKVERQLTEWRMVGIEGDAVNLFRRVSLLTGAVNPRKED